MEILGYSLAYWQIGVFALTALLVGMAKTGVHGAGMIAVPLLALVFGGKNSSGLMLPILIFADVFGVRHYHRHADWGHLRQLLPFALLGVIIGTVVGNYIDDVLFKQIMAGIIFISLVIMIWMEGSKKKKVPTHPVFAAGTGVLGGITTMIGNLAGSVMAVYLLAMQLPKNRFIGTAAWFFLIINVLKIPFHVLAWKTISLNSFMLDLFMIPFIGLGAYLGIVIVERIPEKAYRIFIIVMTAIAAVFMLK